MTKNELVEFLEKGRRTEEAIALYAEHIRNTLYLSGFKKEQRFKMKETLDLLCKESNEHSILLSQLLNEAKARKEDVY
jgi:hypothetical protein